MYSLQIIIVINLIVAVIFIREYQYLFLSRIIIYALYSLSSIPLVLFRHHLYLIPIY